MSKMTSKKVYTPLLPPSTIYEDDPRAVLTVAEQSLYDEVLAHFTTQPVYVLPGVETGELQEQEKFWLSRECILRFLRASKWKSNVAIQRLENTLKWRRGFGIYGDVVSAKHVEPEAVTGKEIVFGYDTKARPAFYMIPSRQNTNEATRQIQFAFWMVERCVDLMEPGVENMTLLINFADRGKNPSFSTARAVLNILQEHYPERLGLALIINVPFFINAFFKFIMPLVDPVTREKVKFNPTIYGDGYFTKEMMMNEWWGGDQDFEYDHGKYWPSLVQICKERSSAWLKSWQKLGGKVGISEWDYKKEIVEPTEKQVEVTISTVEEVATKLVDITVSTVEGKIPTTEVDVPVLPVNEEGEMKEVDASLPIVEEKVLQVDVPVSSAKEEGEMKEVDVSSPTVNEEVAKKQVDVAEVAVAKEAPLDVQHENPAAFPVAG